MIRIFLFTWLVVALNSATFGAKISYTLKMPRPQNHYFQVEMQVEQVKQKTATVKLPVWAPGSYLVREFSRHLNQVKAYSLQGATLPVIKKTKNAWEVDLKGQTAFVLKYEVYAFELSVRTSFLDETHGFVSGPSMFMYLDGHKETGGELLVQPHASFKRISTGLTQKSEVKQGNNQTFTFENASFIGVGSLGFSTGASTAFITFFNCFIVFQNIIPIALYISLEFTKSGQVIVKSWFNISSSRI